ncbi:MAG: cytochrome C oxidase subunit IV family protein [Ignavibacterium sp.]
MNQEESNYSHTPKYGVLILVWLALLMLTGLTVTFAGINLGNLTIATVLIIASIKSYLVLTFFMHLKYESKVFKIFIFVTLFFLIISLVLLFSDYSYMSKG